MFAKLLIANRGEIACRVMRTARALGYRTVAVYSDADADAPHVVQADEAVVIGAAPAAASYLRADALIDAARRSGADAVHPGYGFLSENAAFAQACIDAGLVFVGPPPAAMAQMADKALAKQRMLAAGVPCAPGYCGAEQDDERLAAEAAALGFPLLVKAVAGGGGRGMRLVRGEGELAAAIGGARREAEAAFGDVRLMLERLIEGGRHIEIQVFADAQGNAIHLGERDCSAQRRRQKVVEEAPSPAVDEALRAAMGRDAVAAALAVGYVGAGTVEFIVDPGRGHYFIEMNTRLQVEHPVTELVTGIDLVEWQLRVAAGERLPLAQHDVVVRGHAIEARLYAEDPYARPTPFAPQTGRIVWWRPEAAASQPGVRIDHGIAEGGCVSPHYDPLLAKFVAHGRDRGEAIRRLRAALADAPLLGLRHNARFLADLIADRAFLDAAMTTATIDDWFEAEAPIAARAEPGAEAWCVAAALLAHGSGWRADSVAGYDIALACDSAARSLRVHAARDGTVSVALAEATHELAILEHVDGRLRYTFDGIRRRAVALRVGANEVHLALVGDVFVFVEPSPLANAQPALDARRLIAPVAGIVRQVAARAGDAVAAGTAILCIEAMKMEIWLEAPAAATVLAVHARPGEQVAAGRLLVELDPGAIA